MIKYIKIFLFLVIFLVINACATYKTQYESIENKQRFPEKEIEHSFYLIGDAGNSPINSESAALQALRNELEKTDTNSTVLFLGDNIYPKGLPKKGDAQRAFAEHQLNVQTAVTKSLKGNAIFIPGNHDWYAGLKGLKPVSYTHLTLPTKA